MLRARAALAVAAATVSVIAVAPAAASPFAPSARKTACLGKAPTIFSTKSNVTLKGTKKADVIESTGKNVTITGNGGNDRICGLDVKKVSTGTGNAKVQVRSGAVVTGKGTNTVVQKGTTTKKITFTGGNGVTAFTVPAAELKYATVVPGALGDTLNGQPLLLGLPTGAPRATLIVEDQQDHYITGGTAKVSTDIGQQATYPGSDASFALGYDPGTGVGSVGNNTIRFLTYGVAAPAGATIAGWALDLGDGSAPRTGHGTPPSVLYVPVHGPGVHLARLTVVDSLGRTATSTVNVDQAGRGDVNLTTVVPGGAGPTALNIVYKPGAGAAAVAWAVDFGDGSTPMSGAGAPPASLAHTYPYGDYDPRVWVFDDHGDRVSDSSWLTYTAPPTYALTATPITYPEQPGNVVRVGAAATSALPQGDELTLQLYDPYSAYVSVSWGDGTVLSHYYAHETTISHYYEKPGTYTITVTAVDTPTAATVTTPVTVVPSPVLVSLAAPPAVPQGLVTVSTHTSRIPAGDSWQLFFSDGTPPLTGVGPLPSHFTHTFNAAPSSSYGYYGTGSYEDLEVYDAAGYQVGGASVSFTVTGPQPTVSYVGFGQGLEQQYQGWAPLVAGGTGYAAAALQASAGHTMKTATVSFGDGSAPVVLTDVGGGYLPATETGHTYAAPGDYTLTVTGTDSVGRHAVASSVVSVAGRPTLTLPATESSPTHTFTLTGLAAAAGANDTIVGYTVVWGDNTYTSATGTPPSSIAHTYTSAGTFHPLVYVITSHELYAHATTTATVS